MVPAVTGYWPYLAQDTAYNIRYIESVKVQAISNNHKLTIDTDLYRWISCWGCMCTCVCAYFNYVHSCVQLYHNNIMGCVGSCLCMCAWYAKLSLIEMKNDAYIKLFVIHILVCGSFYRSHKMACNVFSLHVEDSGMFSGVGLKLKRYWCYLISDTMW